MSARAARLIAFRQWSAAVNERLRFVKCLGLEVRGLELRSQLHTPNFSLPTPDFPLSLQTKSYDTMELTEQNKKRDLKQVCVSTTGTVSATASILGSWQICHNLCMGIIALLSLIGITVVGMPLFFLTKIAVPLWSIAAVLLAILFGIYMKKECFSQNMLLLNSGLVIAGIPFQSLQQFSLIFWIIGGSLVFLSIVLFINKKLKNKKEVDKSG